MPAPPYRPGVLPRALLEAWEDAIDAAARALEASGPLGVFRPDERRGRESGIAAERRWLEQLRELKLYGSPPRIEPFADRSSRPNRTISLKALMHEGHHQRADPVRVGELQVWDLVNETGQDHPFHLHGFFFQVVDEDGKAPQTLAWKDTVNVPRKTTTRIAWLPDDRPGQWMYHCHILEHHAMGMMAHFEVVPSA